MSQWTEVRRDFEALDKYAYLDAAAASPTPRIVAERVAAFYKTLGAHGDLAWSGWIDEREAVRERVARFVGAEPDEIAFMPNTSTGINVIVDLLEGDGAVLSADLEFPTVTLPWIHRGIPVHFVPSREGIVRPEGFLLGQAPHGATLALSHVQFANGCRIDLSTFSAIKQHRYLVISASQSCGAFPIDVRRDGVDAMAVGGHKWMCAGYGTGFVFVAKEILDRRPPKAVGWMSGDDPFAFNNRSLTILPSARRAELGCPAFGAIAALGAAVEYLDGIGIEAIASRVLELNAYLTFLLERHGFSVLSPGGSHRSGETLVALPSPRQACAFLRARGVVVTPKPQGVRISTHVYNNEADIEACIDGLVAYRNV